MADAYYQVALIHDLFYNAKNWPNLHSLSLFAFEAKNNMQISTYDIGYGDGFMRLNEDKVSKVSDGRTILGRVSMNNLAIAGNDLEIP